MLAVVLALLVPERVSACSPVQNEPHQTAVLSPVDSVAPGPVIASVERVSLAEHKGPDVGDCSSTSVVVLVVSSSDDRTTPVELGYHLTLISGDSLPLPAGDVRARNRRLYFPWVSAGEERIDSLVGVQAVDLSGNIGPMTEVRVTGETQGGCSISGSAATATDPVGLTALIAFALARRRQQRTRRNAELADGADGDPTIATRRVAEVEATRR
jgi:MYXO-CTERM domain-containing protein